MNTAPHGFVTVDMRGLKAALIVRAREKKVSVSVLVRDAVACTLPSDGGAPLETAPTCRPNATGSTVKLSIRLTSADALRLNAAAKDAGLSRGAFLSGLIDGVRVLSLGGRADHIAALISSSSELSTLSRNVRNLATLLGRSEMRAAQQYRSMLDTLAGEIEKHLSLAGEVLIQMRPQYRSHHTVGRRSQAQKEKN